VTRHLLYPAALFVLLFALCGFVLWLQFGRPSLSSLLRPQTSNDFISIENEHPVIRVGILSEQKLTFLKNYIQATYPHRPVAKVKIIITNVPQRVNYAWENVNDQPVFYAGYNSFFIEPDTIQVNLFLNHDRLQQAKWTTANVANELELLLYSGLVIQFQTSANMFDPDTTAKQMKTNIDAATAGSVFSVHYD